MLTENVGSCNLALLSHIEGDSRTGLSLSRWADIDLAGFYLVQALTFTHKVVPPSSRVSFEAIVAFLELFSIQFICCRRLWQPRADHFSLAK